MSSTVEFLCIYIYVSYVVRPMHAYTRRMRAKEREENGRRLDVRQRQPRKGRKD